MLPQPNPCFMKGEPYKLYARLNYSEFSMRIILKEKESLNNTSEYVYTGCFSLSVIKIKGLRNSSFPTTSGHFADAHFSE